MYTNCHTHIFNIRCAPDAFAGIRVAKKFTRAPWFPYYIAKGMRWILPGKQDNLEKLAGFLEVGIMKSQKQIFENLRSHYRTDVKQVVLTMDMHYMGAGKSEIDYHSQLHQVRELKLTYRDAIIPFIGVDPRRYSGAELKNYVEKFVDKYGFGGIKIYAPLGFYPFDPALNELYAFAQDRQIPIMSHCSQGGINFQNEEILHCQIHPIDFNRSRAYRLDLETEEPLHLLDFTNDAYDIKRFIGIPLGRMKRNKKFKLHFSNPQNYVNVLKQYPKLKICLAHFGGDGQIEEYVKNPKDRNNWHYVVRELMRKYDNVYADVSYSLWNKKAYKPIAAAIADKEIGGKVLFGTDYYMTLQEKEETKLVRDFRKSFSEEDFVKISEENPKKYLEMR